MSTVVSRYQTVEKELAAVIAACGRRRDEVLLLPVSKTVPAECIAELYEYGVRCFGENRAAVLCAKAAALPGDILWHFIGPLQSNKVRKVVQHASMVHSIDDPGILERFDRIVGEEGKRTGFLIEVNISGEASKGGVTPDELDALATQAAAAEHAVWKGLMTMAPLGADEKTLREIFSRLTAERDRLGKIFQHDLPVLSMGMSGDYRVAVACGSTLVRLGTCIFSEAGSK